MNLYINSPAYYSDKYGIDETIYSLSRLIEKSVSRKKYTDAIDSIGIVPIIAPKKILDQGYWKEEIHVSKAYRFADVQLHIDFDQFIKADQDGKKDLFITNIIDSIKAVKKKLKKEFQAEEMINDILAYVNGP